MEVALLAYDLKDVEQTILFLNIVSVSLHSVSQYSMK